MVRILTIDGGGTRGVLPAKILASLEAETGKTLGQLFDVIAGTSTGGIIALAGGAGVPMAKVLDLYLNKAEEIFDDSFLDNLWDGFGKNTGADYSQKNLEKNLRDVFSEKTLRDTLGVGKPVATMVCSFDLNPQEPAMDGYVKNMNFRPRIFNSFHKKDNTENLVNIGLRTSAGPTYFPIREKKYIDGGVALNHPAMAAAAFALNRHVNANGDPKGLGLRSSDEFTVLSLGCGTSNMNIVPKADIKKGDWGNLQWVKYLPDLLTESNIQAAEYYVSQVMPEDHYFRIQHDLTNLIKTLNNGKPITLDVTKPELLLGMEVIADEAYKLYKDTILSFTK